MDDAADLVLVEDPLERSEVGDVALRERDLRELAGRQDELEPRAVLAQVEGDDAARPRRASAVTVQAPMQPSAPVTSQPSQASGASW